MYEWGQYWWLDAFNIFGIIFVLSVSVWMIYNLFRSK